MREKRLKNSELTKPNHDVYAYGNMIRPSRDEKCERTDGDDEQR